MFHRPEDREDIQARLVVLYGEGARRVYPWPLPDA
jgi:hypothetical protein